MNQNDLPPAPDEASCMRCEGKGWIPGSEWLGTDYERLRCPAHVHSEEYRLRARLAILTAALENIRDGKGSLPYQIATRALESIE